MKEVRKYRVINSLTEANIKSVGTSKWMDKNVWWIPLLIVITSICGIAGDELGKSNIVYQYLMLIPLVVAIIIWFYKMMGAGKKYWNKITDKSEPIDLDMVAR